MEIAIFIFYIGLIPALLNRHHFPIYGMNPDDVGSSAAGGKHAG